MAEKKKGDSKKSPKTPDKGKKGYRFKHLSDEEKELLTVTYHDEHLKHVEKIDKMVSKFNVTDRTIRKWWEKLDLTSPNSKIPKQLQIARDRMVDDDTDILLVTSAQNTTAINYNLFDGMLELSKKYNELGYKTQIVVIPMRYRNPTSPTEDISKKNKSQQWWVDEVDSYLYYNKINFGDTKIAADLHTTPTASEPLNGLNAIAQDMNLIVGHGRIHFNTVPRFRNDPLRAMATTGCLTVKNYSRSRVGDKSESHHSYGFCIVEKKKDSVCHMPRNVYADINGNFTDLSYKWKDGKLSKTKKAEAIILGDIHHKLLDEKVYKQTCKITKKIKTKTAVMHDLLDGYNGNLNHHESKDLFLKRQKIVNGDWCIKTEIDAAVNFPNKAQEEMGVKNVYVVHSNHDDFLDKMINEKDYKKDLWNSPAWLEYALIQQTVDLRPHGCIFGYLVNKSANENVKYLSVEDSLRIKGIQVGQHGHKGTNGSRGTISQFKRLSTKKIHGHNHSPTIRDGVSSVGLTAIIKQYYTRGGLSTHANAHMFIFPNGKRQMLCFGDDYKISNFI